MTNPVPYLQVPLNSPLASKYADTESLIADLTFAREAFTRYVLMQRQEGTDSVVQQALWWAGAVAYRRAFNGGRSMLRQATRRSLARDLQHQLTSEQHEAHAFALKMADKHVAHRTAEGAEFAIVTGVVAGPPAPRTVLGIATLGATWLGPPAEGTVPLVEACNVLIELLQAEAQQLSQDVLAEVNATPLDELYALARDPSLDPVIMNK